MESDSYELIAHAQDEDSRLQDTIAIGVSAKKPKLRFMDIAIFAISIGCCASAITVLRVTHLAWYLGYQNQLVVLGLTLSIMNACLSYWRTYFLTLLEARFGRSTLQNYDAILQNAIYGPQTDLYWRVILLGFWILPIFLSVAYKLFTIGPVTRELRYPDVVEFGFYPPLGLEKVGHGIALMANLSLPFIQETTAADNYGADPPEPFRVGTFGLNTLLISHTAVAVLDLPRPHFVADVRQRLQQGETWQVEANVIATVTRQNTTIEQYRDLSKDTSVSFWKSRWHDMLEPKTVDLYNGFEISMGTDVMSNDSTWLFLAFQKSHIGQTPDPDGDRAAFKALAKMFATWREPCTGKWNITRTTMQLVDGSCDLERDATKLDQSYQEVFTNNELGLDNFFVPTLSEFLGPFAIERNSSEWLMPTMTATVAAMMFSRIAALNPPDKPVSPLPHRHNPPRGDMIVTSTRLGLGQSNGLLLVLLIQPALLVLCMATTWLLYAVPVDRTLGLVSILAGVEGDSLRRLGGASLSAKLRSKIRLDIAIYEPDTAQPEIRYTVGGSERKVGDSIKSGILYG